MIKRMRHIWCPPQYKPSCSCYILGDEPKETCYMHGHPDSRRCPYCNGFIKYPHTLTKKHCNRCGWRHKYTIPQAKKQVLGYNKHIVSYYWLDLETVISELRTQERLS